MQLWAKAWHANGTDLFTLEGLEYLEVTYLLSLGISICQTDAMGTMQKPHSTPNYEIFSGQGGRSDNEPNYSGQAVFQDFSRELCLQALNHICVVKFH